MEMDRKTALNALKEEKLWALSTPKCLLYPLYYTQCEWKNEDFRGPSWNKETIASHRKFESTLYAEKEALAAQVKSLQEYIKRLGITHIPTNEFPPTNDLAEESTLVEQTRHLIVISRHVDFFHWLFHPSARRRCAISPPRRMVTIGAPWTSETGSLYGCSRWFEQEWFSWQFVR